MQNLKRPLRRTEASEYLMENWGIARKPATLTKLACVGGGPRFMRANRTPLYPPEDLDVWVQSILTPPAASTSEHDAQNCRRRFGAIPAEETVKLEKLPATE